MELLQRHSQGHMDGRMGMCEQLYGWAWQVSSVPLWAKDTNQRTHPEAQGSPAHADTRHRRAQGKKATHTHLGTPTGADSIYTKAVARFSGLSVLTVIWIFPRHYCSDYRRAEDSFPIPQLVYD